MKNTNKSGFSKTKIIFQCLTLKELKELKKWLVFKEVSNALLLYYTYLYSKSDVDLFIYFQKHQFNLKANTLRKIQSDFRIELEDFSAYKGLQKQPAQRQLLVLEHIAPLVQNIEKYIDASDFQTALETYQLERFKLDFIYLKNNTQVHNLVENYLHLEQFYIQEKLKLLIATHSYQNLFKTIQLPFDEHEFIKQLHPNDLESNTLSKSYFYAYQCLKSKDENAFQILYEMVMNKEVVLDLKLVLMVGVNFCVQKNNLHQPQYQNFLFNLYDYGFQNKIWIEHNTLSAITYRNAIGIALNLKQYQWAESIIETFKAYLKEEEQASNYHFCYAKLHFEQHHYKEALKHLYKVEDHHELLQLNSKTMLLKIYYDSSDVEGAEYLLDSFKSYIQRKKIQGFYKEYFGNFVRLSKKLLNSTKSSQFLKLKLETETFKSLASKEWLLQKINEQLEI